MASQDWFEKDFYAILGVPQDADAATIKKAYRKLARKHHPDQNAGDTAAEQRFKDIGEAHAVLSDPKQREEYDAVRQMAHGGARFRAGGPGRQRRLRGRVLRVRRGRRPAGAVLDRWARRPVRAVSPTSTTSSPRCSAAAAGRPVAPAAPTRSRGSARRAAPGPVPTCRPAPR